LALFPKLIINSDNSNRTLIILTSIIFIVALVSFLINSYIGNITKNVLEKEVFAKFMGNTFSLLLLILSIYSIFLKMTG
jgi:threonine/homoserine/homoserine lactone efflux protein